MVTFSARHHARYHPPTVTYRPPGVWGVAPQETTKTPPRKLAKASDQGGASGVSDGA
ncbi:MAG: hypothetical protein QOI21_4814 [Actinomycetota bacterium]|nr:hypothetical protein [Actinomycetota bacterium]